MKKLMKAMTLVGCICLLSACGYSSKGNEMIGQVKKVKQNTPLVCPDYTDVDISLGVLRGGIGSMSTQDVWAVITDKDQIAIFKQAAESGQLVKVQYDQKRIAICTDDIFVNKVELVK